jgi:hypothetical protein
VQTSLLTGSRSSVGWLNVEDFFLIDFGSNIDYHIHYESIVPAVVLATA